MKIFIKYLKALFLVPFFMALFISVPVRASEDTGVYLGTLGPGQSISTRNIAYGVIQVSATSISEYGGFCSNCSAPGDETAMNAKAIESTYSVLVDGFSVFDYKSTSPGSATIDFSGYSNRDATITMPEEYTLKQVITCKGGRYSSGAPRNPCGYSTTRKITVTGTMQLYGYDNKPIVVSNPQNISCGTDKTITLSVSGEKTVGYRWQSSLDGGFSNLSDGKDSNSVSYSGCSLSTLTIGDTRCALNGVMFRCILIGERGDEVASESAMVTVSDTSAPRVKVSYTPSESTYDGVTVYISASDPDSGLSSSPYYYNGGSHSEKTFKVYENGSYSIRVSDNAGNVAETSVSISNIKPKPTPTPKPTSQPTPQPTSTPYITPTLIPTPTVKPTPIPTPIPTKAPSSSDKKISSSDDKINDALNDDSDENTKKEVVKKVNINNKAEEKVIDKDYNLNTDDKTGSEETVTESVDSEYAYSDKPEEEAKLNEIKESDSKAIIGLSVGLLVLLLLILLAMIFPVRVENADELGTWHFCAIRFVSINGGYSLSLGLLLEDFDTLRLHFGGLFMLMAKGKELKILLEESEEITVEEITQNMTVDYKQARRV